jgi:two-component system nitrate/nitrite response regulator NarL
MSILIIEDHELLAETLRLALTAEGYDVVVPGVERASILVAAAAATIDVVLLDLDLGPIGGDGSQLVAALATAGRRVVVVSGVEDRMKVASCLEAGACGYVPKSAPLDALVDAVRRACAGEPVMAEVDRLNLLAELRQSRSELRRDLAPFESLTRREQFVLTQIMDGLSAAEIAATAFVSEATVRSQIRGVLIKLGVQSQLAAVAAARRAGWHPVSIAH